MYLNWAKDHDYETEILDRQDNEQAGINSATIAVRGPMAYGYLKGESGIHRLVRISPFNAEGKRQTSFAAVDVSPEVSEQADIEIRDEDVEEQVFRASGPGGQHVNKTSSAVRLIHHPTGIAVACQSERSQHKNRATAMKMLRARLARVEEEKREAEQAAKYNQMPRVGLRICVSLYSDETAELCHWHIPETHFLEAWGDARAFDGTVTIMQPLISPLYNGKSAHEVLAILDGHAGLTSHEVVRGYWEKQKKGIDFGQFWLTSLNDGVVADSALAPKPAKGASSIGSAPSQAAAGSMEIVFRPDPSIWDGSFANNSWLQEVAKPITKLTWDNAALVSPTTAQKLGVSNGDMVKLSGPGQGVEAAVWITPGHANDSITLHLGYGRRRAGNIGTGVGFNAYRLVTTDHSRISSVNVQKTGNTYQLVTTQHHHIMGKEGEQREEETVIAMQRKLLRAATLEEFRHDPDFAREEGGASIYPSYPYTGNAWGMSIDLNSCIGCNSCIIACQSENNIAVVGKDQVSRGREMQWIRVDSYYEGGLDNPGLLQSTRPLYALRGRAV